jgi:hypothetical protein
MTTKLTDEQLAELRDNANTYTMVYSPAVIRAVEELVALRAERAKPTRSDNNAIYEAALLIFKSDLTHWKYPPCAEDGSHMTAGRLAEIIASIRAEGRAERAKLEVMLIAALNDEKDKVERVLEDKAEIDAWADRAELELAKLEDARWGYAEIATLAEEGLFIWRSKPHNAKWWSRIDGTPIPNDLVSCIAECIATALAGRAALAPPAESGATELDAMRDHEDRIALHNRIVDEEKEKAGAKPCGATEHGAPYAGFIADPDATGAKP